MDILDGLGFVEAMMVDCERRFGRSRQERDGRASRRTRDSEYPAVGYYTWGNKSYDIMWRILILPVIPRYIGRSSRWH